MKLFGLAFILSLIAGIAPGGESLKLDFGPTKMPPAPGWTRLDSRTLYNKKLGYGWVSEWSRPITWTSPDELTRGSVGGDPGVREGILLADLPDGAYKLTLQAGSASPTEGRMGNCLEANGRIVIGAPGMGGWGKVEKRTVPVVVENGQLKLRFFVCDTKSAYRLNLFSLEIVPVEPGPDADQIIKRWKEEKGKADAESRKIILNGKEFTELGYTVYEKPGNWIQPYLSAGAIVFSRPNPGEILNYTVPAPDDVMKSVSGFGCAGERQPFHFGLYALNNLKDVDVKFSDLRDGEKRIGAGNIKLHTVTCHYQSTSEVVGKNVRLAPELLEKNFPFALAGNSTQPLYAVVEIPAGQSPGHYRGEASIVSGGTRIASFGIQLRVLPFALLSPPDKDWQLFADADRWWQMPGKEIENEMDDMAKHGITGLKIGVVPEIGALIEKDGKITGASFGNLEKYLKYARSRGIDKTLSLASTNTLIWSLRTWSFSGKNGGSGEVVAEGNEHLFQMKNPADNSLSEASMRRWGKVPADRKLNFSIRYRNTGSAPAKAELLFFDRERRRTCETDKVLYLPPTGSAFAEKSAECASHKNASQFLVGVKFSGKGELTVADMGLKETGSELNLISNPQLLRDLKQVDFLKEWPAHFVEVYEEAVKANVAAAEKLGFECYIDGTDEAGNDPKTEKKEISELKYAKLGGGKTWCNLSPALAEKSAEYLDAVCFYSSLFGNEKQGRDMIEKFRRQGKKIYYISAGTYEGQDFGIMPNRYNVGFFFWKSSCDGTAIWTFMRPSGNPFDDLDARYRDHCLVYPPRKEGGEPVPTIAWEGIGEGRRDFNYMYTLEQAVGKAEKDGRASHAEKGKRILDFIRQAVPWCDGFDSESFDNSAANSLRWLAAWGIMEVNGPGDEKTGISAEKAKTVITLKTSKPMKTPKQLTWCPVTDKAPVPDGKLDDAVWKNAGLVKDFAYYMNPRVKAEEPTEVYMMHDRENLYLGFRCFTKNRNGLKSEKRPHDGNVFADDSIEMFFNNSNDKNSFYQLCFNASGSKFDQEAYGSRNLGQNAFMINYDKKQVRNPGWNGEWQVAAVRYPDRWEAEVVIPFKTLERRSDVWGMVFGRNNRAAGETTSSKAIGFFDQPEFYPEVAFAGFRGSEGKVTMWRPEDFYAGPNLNIMETEGANVDNIEVRITGRNSKVRTCRAKNMGKGKFALEYELTPEDKALQVALSGPEKDLLNYFFPLDIPAPLKLKTGRQVFFGDVSTASAKVILNLSPELARKGRIRLRLEKDGQVAATANYKAEEGNAMLEIPLKGLPDGFYTLNAEFEYNSRIYSRDQLSLMLAPGY